ncbi:MAG: hypothetical protein PHY77_07455 [Desulfotomaculaceae bacterium]|nr:hypothetical protein [Desulfotomaculaceae bacterium]
MLKEEVLRALKKDLFHIYVVKSIEEGIELFGRGLPAGIMNEDGDCPHDDVFGRAGRMLAELSKVLNRTGNGHVEDKELSCSGI